MLIESVACCVNAIDRAAIRCGERIALVGCGFMGSILLQGLLLTPARAVAAFDVRPELLEKAAAFGKPYEKQGLLSTHDPSALGAGLKEFEGAFDAVIETAATEAGFRLADRLVKKDGRLIVFSWHHHVFPVDLGSWHVRGLSVLNVSPAAHSRFDECFHQSISLLEKQRIDLKPLVTHVAPPENAQGLYEKGLRKTGGYIKGAIRWS